MGTGGSPSLVCWAHVCGLGGRQVLAQEQDRSGGQVSSIGPSR